MKIKAPWKCDYCGTVKGENNHWLMRDRVVPTDDHDVFIMPRWNEEQAGREFPDGTPIYEHICGNVCAGRALEKWLGSAGN
jgi:hypothetical protein